MIKFEEFNLSMTKIWSPRGYGNPVFAIPVGILFLLIGLDLFYSNGINFLTGLSLLGGIVFTIGGIYSLTEQDDEEDD